MENTEDQQRHWSQKLAFIAFLCSIVSMFLWSIVFAFPDAYVEIMLLALLLMPTVLLLNIISLIFMPNKKTKNKSVTHAVTGILLIFLLAMVFPLFIKCDVHRSKLSQCSWHASCLGLRILSYADDNDDRFPLLDKWNNAITEQSGTNTMFICPCEYKKTTLPCYAMNGQLRGLRTRDVVDPEHTVLLFESRPGKNLYGGPELFPKKPRHFLIWHQGCYVVKFVDLHGEFIKQKDINTLNWDPKKKILNKNKNH